MTQYSPELKQQIVKKMMPPNSQSVAAISREAGISGPTLYAGFATFVTWKICIRRPPGLRWKVGVKQVHATCAPGFLGCDHFRQ